MAEAAVDQEVEEGVEGEEGEEQQKRKGLSGKKLVLFIVLPVLLLALAGGGGAAYFLGFFGGDAAEGVEEAEAVPDIDPSLLVFHELEEMIVNLNSTGKQKRYLKLKVQLELEDEEMASSVTGLIPRVIDQFQVYLREVRPEDLQGAAGLYRLKEELLIRINTSIQPLKVNDVLIKEFIVQ